MITLFLKTFGLLGIIILSANADVDTSGFQVVAPQALKSLYSAGMRHRDALFGMPPYGGSLTGILVYATQAVNQTGCTKLTRDPTWPQNSPIVVLIDRGSCDFVVKALHAQEIHAVAAVIVDNKCLCGQPDCAGVSYPNCDYSLPVMADDGQGGSVQIPSYLISKYDGQQLKDCISGVSTLAGCTGQDYVVVKLSWDLPKPDNRVEWELWTSADDSGGMAFKDEFEPASMLLGSHSLFTPRYFVYDGNLLRCTQPGEPCGNQCAYGGKYCNPDPNHNLNTGLSGADVVQENLRRICIWKQANATYATSFGKQWWYYVSLFNKQCWSQSQAPAVMKQCSDSTQLKTGLDPLKTAGCITASNVGPSTAPTDNTLLAFEVATRSKSNIFITPTVVVNGVIERGGTNQAAVLTTICNGYLDGTQPEVCKCTQLATLAIPNCVAITSQTGVAPVGTDTANGGTGSAGVSYGNLGLIIGAVVLVIGSIALFGYIRNKRRHEERLRSEVRNILQEYMPLNDDMPLNDTIGEVDGENDAVI